MPKVLRPLVQEWTPEGYIVSFKVSLRMRRAFLSSCQLETEQALLIPKSRAALSRYGHQLVIGNDLHKRKQEVVFVERQQPTPQKGSGDSRLHGAQTPPVTDRLIDGDSMFPPSEQYKESWIRLSDLPALEADKEIEEVIVKELLERHTRWIEAGR